jgi:two-component system, chemotaxis family, protein-glutamate methylesterase/glutaminase
LGSFGSVLKPFMKEVHESASETGRRFRSPMSLPRSYLPVKVKVLIADDSSFMRGALSRMVESDDSLCVVGTAETGLETLVKIGTLHPDVVTLDIDMPGLSGLETLRRVMLESPLPVIIVSSTARRGAEDTLEALALGAFDCIAKQLSYDSVDVLKVQSELVGMIKAAAGPRLPNSPLLGSLDRPPLRPNPNHITPGYADRACIDPTYVDPAYIDPAYVEPARRAPAIGVTVPSIIAIGASTGGPKALQEVLSALPADLSAGILIVQHMPIGFIKPLAKRLNDICPLTVHEAEAGDVFTAGHVYFAPTGRHLTVRRLSSSEVVLHLSVLPGDLANVPSVDVMMSSVAEVFGASAMGIILTGMGDDGTLGMQAICREGGLTLGQDQATCVIYGMPRSCAEMGVLSQVVPLPDVARNILAALHYRKPH